MCGQRHVTQHAMRACSRVTEIGVTTLTLSSDALRSSLEVTAAARRQAMSRPANLADNFEDTAKALEYR